MGLHEEIGRAYDLSCRGEYDLALVQYDVVLGLDPQNAFALYQRGYCHYAKCDYDRALPAFLLAMRAGPSMLDEYRVFICRTYCGQAARYHESRRFDQAIAAYTEAMRLHDAPTGYPGYTLFLRGNCYFDKEDYAAAIADYDAALALGYSGYNHCVMSQRALAARYWSADSEGRSDD